MDLLGGHPYLIQMALYHISHRQISVEELVNTSVDDRSIYRDHLLNHVDYLKKNPLLFESLKSAFSTKEEAMIFNDEQAYKLEDLGLIKKADDANRSSKKENKFIPRCDLYRQYFSK
jgi:putative cell wall-binding protein